jgi:hypothetical protein
MADNSESAVASAVGHDGWAKRGPGGDWKGPEMRHSRCRRSRHTPLRLASTEDCDQDRDAIVAI